MDRYTAAESIAFGKPRSGWRLRLFNVIFESDTRAGRLFDVVLLAAILLSVVTVLADSVEPIAGRHATLLHATEWLITALFTIEYIARLSCVRHPRRYAASFFGIVDLLAIAPAYLALLLPEAQPFMDVRVLRLLRVFRIFKLVEYIGEYRVLGAALLASRRKILVFLSVVVMVVLIAGTVMYAVEGPQHGYTSIPLSVYWAIITMTTVGYGDITPHTNLGRAIASLMMLIGWGILAVPTGIVTAEMTAQRFGIKRATERTCDACSSRGHDADARFCKNCGAKLSGEA
jgi:voltage-gated potassium channel